ncbi:hypothetical protein ElyMa_002214100 [Elysia marginata]|uniref:Uncharacterized protein n=1 Tax=Elysia marginata TaxID=1093978 RepID=A0AAV4FSS9_9GAST|nr:hypothetical protein ElyMa_002214100 [Elysia marginata]
MSARTEKTFKDDTHPSRKHFDFSSYARRLRTFKENKRLKEQVEVKVGAVGKTEQLEIVKFSKFPTENNEVLNCCDKEDTPLPWELITANNFNNRIKVSSIVWHRRSKADVAAGKQGQEIAKTGAGGTTTAQSTNQSSVDGALYRVEDGDPNGIKKLVIKCDTSMDENEIVITVKFDRGTFLSQLSDHARSRVARSPDMESASLGDRCCRRISQIQEMPVAGYPFYRWVDLAKLG